MRSGEMHDPERMEFVATVMTHAMEFVATAVTPISPAMAVEIQNHIVERDPEEPDYERVYEIGDTVTCFEFQRPELKTGLWWSTKDCRQGQYRVDKVKTATELSFQGLSRGRGL